MLVQSPGHSHADKHGYASEHVLAAELAIGHRLPPQAVVHHVDGRKDHNVNSNLIICNDQTHHMLLHQRLRAFRACGHADWLRCRVCRCWDDPKSLCVSVAGKRRDKRVEHIECRRVYERGRKRHARS